MAPRTEPPSIEWLDLALLGEYFDRKNRGRGFILTRLDQAAPVIDTVGVDSLASEVTITCGVQPSTIPPGAEMEEPAPAGTVYTPPVKGLLFWGNDGVETFAEFDFLAGTVLSISAASVRVLATLDEGANPELPTFVAPLVVAHIGYYPRGGQNAQRTRFVDLTEAGGADNRARIAIPPYARQVAILQTTSLVPAGASYDLSFLTAEPPAVVLAGERTAEPLVQRPIPQGARVIEILNNADNAARFQLIFRLWL